MKCYLKNVENKLFIKGCTIVKGTYAMKSSLVILFVILNWLQRYSSEKIIIWANTNSVIRADKKLLM